MREESVWALVGRLCDAALGDAPEDGRARARARARAFEILLAFDDCACAYARPVDASEHARRALLALCYERSRARGAEGVAACERVHARVAELCARDVALTRGGDAPRSSPPSRAPTPRAADAPRAMSEAIAAPLALLLALADSAPPTPPPSQSAMLVRLGLPPPRGHLAALAAERRGARRRAAAAARFFASGDGAPGAPAFGTDAQRAACGAPYGVMPSAHRDARARRDETMSRALWSGACAHLFAPCGPEAERDWPTVARAGSVRGDGVAAPALAPLSPGVDGAAADPADAQLGDERGASDAGVLVGRAAPKVLGLGLGSALASGARVSDLCAWRHFGQWYQHVSWYSAQLRGRTLGPAARAAGRALRHLSLIHI